MRRASEARVAPDARARDPYELSIVLPCLNEARSVGRCVDEAMAAAVAAGVAAEVIVADNGSTDTSAEIAEAHGARVVRVALRGYGAALRGGVEAARGTYVLFADADGQHDFDDLAAFVAKLREGYDLVIGNRFAGAIEPGAMPASHRYL
ncbi:MAG TPA: glycosyltransferase family 2 protein, partial [Solirubrobacteraceae bacterium]|nr:glycosyltransferase family 2 protein [Solirubrobacteraceae bacterium]